MKEVKSGVKTSEFWIASIVNIAAAVIAILAGRGLVASEEGDLYVVLVQSIAVAVAPIVMAFVTGKYIDSRATVKNGGSR